MYNKAVADEFLLQIQEDLAILDNKEYMMERDALLPLKIKERLA